MTARDYRAWLTACAWATALLSVSEALIVAVRVPYVSLEGAGLYSLWASLFLLHALLSVPCALLLAWLAPWFGNKRLGWSTPLLLACATGVWSSVALIRGLHGFLAKVRVEFPNQLDHVDLGGTLALVVAVLPLSWLVYWASARLTRAVPRLEASRQLASVFALLLAGQALMAVYQGIEPLHVAEVMGVPELALLALSLGAMRGLSPVVIRPGGARLGMAVLALGCAIGVMTVGGRQVRFVLHHHAALGGWVAGRLRDLLDFDGDGTSPTWAGGTDCAPFDQGVSALEPERPGDGIDQDCWGGDASPTTQPDQRAVLRDLCGAPPKELSLLLVTIDALRADAAEAATMPNLGQLRAESIVFSNAYAAATMTRNALAVMFAGRPLAKQVVRSPLVQPQYKLAAPVALLLARAGWATGATVFADVPPAALAGFSAVNGGVYDLFAGGGGALQVFSSSRTTDSVMWFLEQQTSGRFFAWAHYLDPHAPYLDVRSGEVEQSVHAYLGELGYTDHHLGRLIADLKRRRLWERTALIVSADHGEALGDFGHEGHGVDAYQSTIHVPLLIRVPGCTPQVVSEPVSLTELAATLKYLAGLPGAEGGPNLLRRTPSPDPVVVEAYSADLHLDERRYSRAVVRGDHKLIHDVRNGGSLLFDVRQDPHETRDLYGEAVDATRQLLSDYQAWLDR